MCIQSVGEKSALNAIFLGPPSSSMMAISGGTMQSYCSSRFFDFFWRLLLVKIPHLAFIDENLNGISDHLSEPYYCPPPNYLKNGFCWRRKPRLCLHYIV